MTKTAVIVGVGPGLGMSIAHRVGREGYRTVLVSRSDRRHAEYLAALTEAGVEAEALVADVRDEAGLRAALDRAGQVDLVYYGPGAVDEESARPKPIEQTDPASVQQAMSWVYPAISVVNHVLPGMLERGEGGLLFAGGLSAVRPMPALGNLAVSSAAIRNYAVTLHAALAERNVYAGTLIIGGAIERGDIHQMLKAHPEQFGDVGGHTLDPDELAEAAWQLYAERDRAEVTFDVLDAVSG